jgi:hypothetical protein
VEQPGFNPFFRPVLGLAMECVAGTPRCYLHKTLRSLGPVPFEIVGRGRNLAGLPERLHSGYGHSGSPSGSSGHIDAASSSPGRWARNPEEKGCPMKTLYATSARDRDALPVKCVRHSWGCLPAVRVQANDAPRRARMHSSRARLQTADIIPRGPVASQALGSDSRSMCEERPP